MLDEIDPQLFEAAVARDQATLLTRKADVARVKAQLEQSTNDLNRAKALRRKNKDYIGRNHQGPKTGGRRQTEKALIVRYFQAIVTASMPPENSRPSAP